MNLIAATRAEGGLVFQELTELYRKSVQNQEKAAFLNLLKDQQNLKLTVTGFDRNMN